MKSRQSTKVAFVYHYLAHYREPVFRALAHSDALDVTVISGTETNMSIELVSPEMANRKVEDGGLPWEFVRNRWFGPVLWQHGLVAKLLRGRYDAVVFLGSAHYVTTWLAALLLRFRSTTVCMWGHGLLAREHGPKSRLREVFYRLADTHFIYSGRSIDLMREKSLLSGRQFYQVNNALDHDAHLALRAEADSLPSPFPAADLRLVFVGRLTARKRLGMAVEAVAELKRRGVSAVLAVVGDGDERRHLETLAGDLDVADRVVFTGALYDECELSRYLHHADICVSPGHVGLTAIHAMSFGTPVVTHGDLDSHAPEVEAIEAGATGAFFDAGSVDGLVDALVDLNVNQNRDDFRRRCYHRVDSHYTPDFQVMVFEKGLGRTEADLPVTG